MVAVGLFLAAVAGASDMRLILQEKDLAGMLAARGGSCAGCTTEQLVDKLRATDQVGRELASKGRLDIVVRYCAS